MWTQRSRLDPIDCLDIMYADCGYMLRSKSVGSSRKVNEVLITNR